MFFAEYIVFIKKQKQVNCLLMEVMPFFNGSMWLHYYILFCFRFHWPLEDFPFIEAPFEEML